MTAARRHMGRARAPNAMVFIEIPNRGRALTIDSGWRGAADTALRFVQRLCPKSVSTEPVGPFPISEDQKGGALQDFRVRGRFVTVRTG
jgi:hypothetical protein